ncbi:ribitol 5-phosphate transferase FKRP-like [Babylonia areolata]|uniref:ribitol 5-phosphate transferase FKRP-like n=1 Tax=Babylonia areolata TaxID=304850 RepID=UPI003FCF888F
MAVRRQRLVYGALLVNLLVMIYLAFQQHRYISNVSNPITSVNQYLGDTASNTPQSVANRITVILRDFEMFDNAIVDTIRELYSELNGTKVLIVGDSHLYPPLQLDVKWNVDVVSLKPDLLHNYSSSRPDHLIKTKYVLVLPDGAKFKHWKHIQKAMNMLGGKGRTKAVVLGVGTNSLHCMSMGVDVKRWQMSLWKANVSADQCDLLVGDQAVLLLTENFRSLAEPFARPFPTTFYIQAKVRDWKVRYMRSHQLVWVKALFSAPHNKWKHKRLEEERLSVFYRQWGIKAVVHPDGKTDYYGCTRTTPRCFGTIINDMPEYLYEGKWTPPCCLKALRETARHVFSILQQEGVRYWLEGGSLLGAARNGDIIPWDYDGDVGIYKEDIEKSSHLKDALENSFVDEEGFVWEKAAEGDFFRVQYSEHNHMHMDIHPFYSKDGTMTKNTWFKTHRQDTEFPEHFLTPLTKIPFVGVQASAPNHVKEFLEFKFGKGVIEQPRFPNYKRVQ